MRQKPTTSGYAERLTRARERGPRPISVRALHKALEKGFPNLRGTSYGGVRHYAEGKVTAPRVELLRAMADVLEVRPDWLAFGEGEMTEAMERARGSEPEAEPSRDSWWDLIREGVRDGFGEGADWLMGIQPDRIGPRALIISRTWRVVSFSPVGEAMAPPGMAPGPRQVAEAIGRALRAPLDALGIDPTGPLPDDEYDEYVMAVCSGLRRLSRVSTKQEETHDPA